MPYNDQYQKLQTHKLMATVWTDDSNKTLVLFNIKIVPFELHAPMAIMLNIILTSLWSVLEYAIFSKFFVVYFSLLLNVSSPPCLSFEKYAWFC